MNILLLNTSDRIGGAAVACVRLLHALRHSNRSAQLLVQEQLTDIEGIASTTHSSMKRLFNQYRFIRERLRFSLQESSRDVRFAFSLADTGEDISHRQEVLNTDLLHVHWINRGFLSLRSLERLMAMKKPIVWTLHDMWLFTGGCHYAGECTRFETGCHHCPFIKHPGQHDLSAKIFQKKIRLFSVTDKKRMTFAACSQWLAEKARNSRLLSGCNIISIPNPIDETVYVPQEKNDARKRLGLPLDKKLVLFGAGNIFDKRKGLNYLIHAFQILQRKHPALSEQIAIVLFGKSKQAPNTLFSLPIHDVGVLTDEQRIVSLYNACDLFVLPSTEDNLPNTVMESLACGTPVVAFRTGGIPEMIEHLQNGFLAEYRNAESLEEGIVTMLFSDDNAGIRQRARAKVERDYTPKSIAEKYYSVYEQLMSLPK